VRQKKISHTKKLRMGIKSERSKGGIETICLSCWERELERQKMNNKDISYDYPVFLLKKVE
jgi:hypothetical protein